MSLRISGAESNGIRGGTISISVSLNSNPQISLSFFTLNHSLKKLWVLNVYLPLNTIS